MVFVLERKEQADETGNPAPGVLTAIKLIQGAALEDGLLLQSGIDRFAAEES